MMHSTTFNRHTHQRGFTLLELVALLSMLSGLIFALVYKTTDISIQRAVLATNSSLETADAQLLQFAAWNGRFPCPDNNGDGVEDCSSGQTKGTLPYRTLGLSALGYQPGEQGEQVLRYGIYRNPAADLAVQKEVFKPTDADLTAYDFGNKNSLDLCQALDTAASLGVNTGNLYMQHPDASQKAVAYVLASPGPRDADGANGPYDGLNGSSTTGFNAPETPVSSNYDDQIRSRGFSEVFRLLHCEVAQRSLDLAANAIALETENIEFAESNQESANEGVVMNAVGTGLALWSLAQAGAALSSAVETLGKASFALGTAVTACAAPPFAGCPLVPVYTTAVSLASTGVTLSQVALGLAGPAVGLQAAATVLYVTIADKTGVPSTAPAGTGVTQAMVDEAWAEHQGYDQTAQQAEAAYSSALTAYNATELTNANATLTTLEDKMNDLDTALADNMTGKNTDELRDELYGFPRPEDLDPNNPPDASTVILGARPVIDAWRSAEADAKRMAGVDLVDENGNPILDENGDPIDLDANAATAQSTAVDEVNEARTVAEDLVNTLCPQPVTTTCQRRDELLAAFDAHMDAYQQERETWYAVEAKKAEAEDARKTADGAYDKWGALNCALSDRDYDPGSNSCTAGAPGSGATSGAQNALCDTSSDAYDADACADMQDSSNVLCDTSSEFYNQDACAALGSSSGLIEYFTGMDTLVRQLDAKGSVR
ncbi:MAG: type II secretion system protein [Marinobacterium sp.]